eukprot:6719154-Prymnesium_polylepis.1
MRREQRSWSGRIVREELVSVPSLAHVHPCPPKRIPERSASLTQLGRSPEVKTSHECSTRQAARANKI